MTTETESAQPRRWLSLQVLLGIAGIVSFVCVLIHLNTVYEGLPAHPLMVHVPVILIPTDALGGLILVAKPAWFERHSGWLCGLTILTLAALDLTINAGGALRNDLGLYGDSTVDNLVSRHAHAAGILQIFVIAYAAVFIVAVALERHSRGLPSGLGFVDALVGWGLRLMRGLRPVRVLLGLVAIGCLYFVFLTGDLGARAVWQGRVQAAHAVNHGRYGAPQVAQP